RPSSGKRREIDGGTISAAADRSLPRNARRPMPSTPSPPCRGGPRVRPPLSRQSLAPASRRAFEGCYPSRVSTAATALLGALVPALNLVQAAVLAALLALALRALVLLAVDRGRAWGVKLLRVTAVALFLAAGLLYGWFSAPMVVWDGFTVMVAILIAV